MVDMGKKSTEILVDGCSIFIENLEQLNKNTHDASTLRNTAIAWTTQGIEQTLKPVISIFKSLQNAAKDVTPDEIELSMQLDIGLNGEIPVLKIVSAEATAQIAVKLVWKSEK